MRDVHVGWSFVLSTSTWYWRGSEFPISLEVRMIVIIMLLLVWSVVFQTALTIPGHEKLYESLSMITLLEDPKDERFSGLETSIAYTFPVGFNCFDLKRDASIFSERVIARLQESRMTQSAAMTIGDDRNIIRCRGFLVLARDLESFKSVMSKLPKWAKHRVYGLVEKADEKEITSMLQDEINLLGDAEIVLFVFGKWSSGFKVGQPRRNLERLGDISQQSWEMHHVDGHRVFYGRELRFTTRNCSQFSTYSEDGDFDKFGGIDWKVFKEAVRRMNVTLKFVGPLPGSYIGEIRNGTWQGGLMGNVYQGYADVAFCGITIERSKINTGVQISSPIQKMCVNFAVPRPKRASESWFAIFSPFSGQLLVMMVLTVLFVSGVLRFTAVAIKLLLGYRAKYYESWGNSFMVIYGELLLGSWPSSKGIKLGPLNHVLASWVFFVLLVTTSFSSTLVSHLAKPKFAEKPQTIRDLLDMGYSWTVSTPFPVERILNMQDPDAKEWASHLEVILDFDVLLSALRNRKHTVIIGADIWGVFIPYYHQPYPDEILDRFETMDACLTEVFEGFIFRVGSPFNDALSFYINHMREIGLLGKYGREVVGKAVSKNPVLGRLKQSVESQSTPARPLSLSQLRGAFAILLIGHAVAAAAFLMEKLYQKQPLQ